MDPISTFVAAIVAGAVEAAKPTSVQVVKDAYEDFKALIIRKFSSVSTPLQGVIERPTSESRQSALREELADAGADHDMEVSSALQNLIITLQQHAPQSVAHLTAPLNDGGRTLQTPVRTDRGNTTIQTGGGAAVQGSVSVAGNFIGRDQTINNINLYSVGQVEDLTLVLKATMSQLISNPEPDAFDAMAVVLDEISKLYQLIEAELIRYLSLSFDNKQQMVRDRKVLLSLDGGQIRARAKEARGHCGKISLIYYSRLRSWFKSRITPDLFIRVEDNFGNLADSDTDMMHAIDLLADWLSRKASQTLDLMDAGDIGGARRLVKDSRIDCQGMRQKLAHTISTMRDLQAELLQLSI